MPNLSKLPAHLTTGIVYSDTNANFTLSTTIYPKGTILISDQGSGYYSIKIADGTNTWSNLLEYTNSNTTLKVATGTLLANTNTITLPWTYDQINQNVLVFIGSVKQTAANLSFPTNQTITLNENVTIPTPYEVIMIPSALIPQLPVNGYNYIIDGAFDFWYENTTQSTGGYGSDTMWINEHNTTTKVHTRQSFAVGDIFPDGVSCPTYYSRTTVTSVVNASSYCIKGQKIEDVGRLAGKTVTLSFYAKADAAKNIAIDAGQIFGTGGSPSATIWGIGAQLISLTTAWKKYTINITFPSIASKVLGTNNDSSTYIRFWFDAGSNYNSVTGGLGQQPGVFDITLVKLEEGKVATPYVRDLGLESTRIDRYYEVIAVDVYQYNPGSGAVLACGPFRQFMRGTPAFATVTSIYTLNNGGPNYILTDTVTNKASGWRVHVAVTTSGQPAEWRGVFSADSRL